MRGYTEAHSGTRQEPQVPLLAVNGFGEGRAARDKRNLGWQLLHPC